MKNTRDIVEWFVTFEELAIRQGLYRPGHIDRDAAKKLFDHGYNAGAAVSKLKQAREVDYLYKELTEEKLSDRPGENAESLQNQINGPLKVQELEVSHHGYEGWDTYTIRTKENYCLAVVGQVDRATSGINKQAAELFASAPELLEALENLFKECSMIHRHWGGESNAKAADAAIQKAKNLLTKLNEVTK